MTRIGRPEAEVHQDIQLKGLGIANEHCIIEVVDKEVYLTAIGNAKFVSLSIVDPVLISVLISVPISVLLFSD